MPLLRASLLVLISSLIACSPVPRVYKTAQNVILSTPEINGVDNNDDILNLTRTLPLGHVVVKGDNLYQLSQRYQQQRTDLITWNQLTPPYKLYPGQVLQVSFPGGGWQALLNQQHNNVQNNNLNQINYSPNGSNKKPSTNTFKPYIPPYQHRRLARHLNWNWPSRGQVQRLRAKTGRQGIFIYGRVDQPVYAAESGQVIYSGHGLNGYNGHLIIIRHNAQCLSVYAHNRKHRALPVGTQVKRGQAIASMGYNNRQRAALRFEISCAQKTVDPLSLLN